MALSTLRRFQKGSALAGLVAAAVLTAACAEDAESVAQPAALAMTEVETRMRSTTELANEPVEDENVMRFVIAGETFELNAAICNTYEDGTFRFALAEGVLDREGRMTATIERYDSGTSFDTLIALEGIRDDQSSMTWYAKDSAGADIVSETVIGAEIRGTTQFGESEDDPGAATASGAFSLRCATAAAE